MPRVQCPLELTGRVSTSADSELSVLGRHQSLNFTSPVVLLVSIQAMPEGDCHGQEA